MKKLLFATDFSNSCENALHYIVSLVKGKEIKVDICHVYDIPITDSSYIPYAAVQGMIDIKKDATIKRLKDSLSELPEAQRGEAYPIFGVYPSAEITEKAEEIKADLIVMALRQKYSLMDRMVGSVTAHTIQKATVPVLAIPATATYSEFDDILFPCMMDSYLELTEPEKKAMEWLYSFWDLFDGPKVHLLHIEESEGDETMDITFKNSPFKKMDFIISHAEDVHTGILQKLMEIDSDLIAVYKPHRKFWERLFHNSETKKLLYHSPVPLLVFH